MTTAAPTARSVAEALNRLARRVFQSGRQAEWSSAVVDAALEFCERAALFTVQGSRLRLELASFSTNGEVSVALQEAPAIAETISSREPVAAAWSARELSTVVTDCFGAARGGRAYLFPIASGGRVVSVLLADGGAISPDTNGLELICGIGGAAWELAKRRNESAPSASNGLVTLTPTPPLVAASVAEDDYHRRARRFASVRVAELSLYQAAQVRDGRLARNLYDLFREAIERARATFRTEFLEKSPSMADYLHEELVRTLAQGEPDRMGENYPGAMVRS